MSGARWPVGSLDRFAAQGTVEGKEEREDGDGGQGMSIRGVMLVHVRNLEMSTTAVQTGSVSWSRPKSGECRRLLERRWCRRRREGKMVRWMRCELNRDNENGPL